METLGQSLLGLGQELARGGREPGKLSELFPCFRMLPALT